MIKSVFSNGFEDIYKGNRAVAAAWMITKIADGSVYASGHSLDLDKAQKTARGNLPRLHSRYKGRDGAWTAQYLAKEWGCRPSQAIARADQENAELQAKYKIEVVAL